MVKVLAIEGNRIKLSRKALIKEQKAKLGQSASAPSEETEYSQPAVQDAPVRSPRSSAPRNEFDERQPSSNQSTILIEGGDDFDEDGGGVEIDEANEPNFNRVDGAPVVHAGGPPFSGGARPGGSAGAGANNRRRRRRGGRRPGGGQG